MEKSKSNRITPGQPFSYSSFDFQKAENEFQIRVDPLERVFLCETEGFRFASEPSGRVFLCKPKVSDSFQIRLRSDLTPFPL